jgi:hypothetical protein
VRRRRHEACKNDERARLQGVSAAAEDLGGVSAEEAEPPPALEAAPGESPAPSEDWADRFFM